MNLEELWRGMCGKFDQNMLYEILEDIMNVLFYKITQQGQQKKSMCRAVSFIRQQYFNLEK